MTKAKSVSEAGEKSRRQFLARTGMAAATIAMVRSHVHAAESISAVHANGDDTIRLALIGAGPRGRGAVVNALSTADQGPIELYAVADLSETTAASTPKVLARKFESQVNVPPERQFVGFDAYRHAIDSLRPGDVALCTTRSYIRPLHVEYAVSKGVNVFMEKPFAPDPVSLVRMQAAGKMAEKTGSKIAAGLQCRHSPARHAMIDKVRNGELGEIPFVRANRTGGRSWMGSPGPKANEFAEQLNFGRAHLLWIGSGRMVDYLIHQIDECCWIMDDWPVECRGMGGRTSGHSDHGQNLHSYSMEFVFADGRRALCGYRAAKGGHNEFATFIHGSKHAGQFSGNIHAATVHMYEGTTIDDDKITWRPEADSKSPWDYEWIHFIEAIRADKPYNECERAVMADFVSLMGRAACHSNSVVTLDDVLNSSFAFCNNLDELSFDSQPPALPNEEGYFAAPASSDWVEL